MLARSGHSVPSYRDFHAEPKELRSVGALVMGTVMHPKPEDVIQFGLFLLIATPVARVFFSMIAFALERDRLYVVLTLIVLTVLMYSVLVPHG